MFAKIAVNEEDKNLAQTSKVFQINFLFINDFTFHNRQYIFDTKTKSSSIFLKC